MKALRGLAAIVIALFVLAGCSGVNGNDVSPSSPPAAASASPKPSAPDAATAVPSASPVASSSAAAETPEVEASPAPSASAAAPSSGRAATGEEKPEVEASAEPSEPVAQRVVFSIMGNEEWGTIVDNEQVDLKDGDTAASVLKRVAKAHRLAYEIRGSGAFTYIEGIDGLYEFDNGPTSGWKFRVNGVVSDLGAGVYELEPGDRLEWIYVNSDELAASGEESAP
ncbi:DUF4430 domain-containing protein [Cohnella panacarvi]|uniref:DUF4430 domain-containing protein n=1 Tax=Cohnella panacarvi TaxID=400776 RepID=UPI00047BA3D3|nr:DUF4430 domain-containing protein [Cohnella panacarvi]